MRQTPQVRLKADATTGFVHASALILALAMTCAAGASARAPHARVELLADQTAVTPGGDVTLGVRFILDEGWHIYWRNPGESGGSPVVTWKVPPELVVSDVQWPVPERFSVPGDTTYGYQRGALLLAPAKYTGKQAGVTLPVDATIEYQICKDVCVKETAKVSAPLMTGAGRPSDTAVEFATARDRLPKPMPATWKAAASVAGTDLVMTITTGEKETAGSFLPYQSGLIIDSADARVEPRPDGMTITIKKAAEFTAPKTIEGILIRPGTRAVEIRAEISR